MSVFIFIIMLLIGFIIYFTPMIVAGYRHHKYRDPIAIINFCFGWTFIGWVFCLAWSFSPNTED